VCELFTAAFVMFTVKGEGRGVRACLQESSSARCIMRRLHCAPRPDYCRHAAADLTSAAPSTCTSLLVRIPVNRCRVI
jgi:hypothetical protein